jgi:DGQHR domain-containing protein
MGLSRRKYLTPRALLLRQNDAHPLYLFSLTGEELYAVAGISQISRDDEDRLIGYQRPEVRRHVEEMVAYLNGKDILFPHPIVLSLRSVVRFKASRGPRTDNGLVAAGTLEIPLPRERERKPAWIVDGQQRTRALLKSARGAGFAVPVSAFVTDKIDDEREQFLLLNNTRPLPRGLITELLPEVSASLPAKLAARKVPAAICEWLNQSPDSPFHRLIRRASSLAGGRGPAVVADTSVVQMIEESLSSTSGCLFPYRNIATGETDGDGICAVLVAYWAAVRNVFPDAWGKPPGKSRLMHGAGIRSMGRLMDRVMAGIDARHPKTVQQIERELRLVAPFCRWTDGAWEELNDLPWNDVQNVPRHIRVLSNYLIRTYLLAKGAVR